MTDEQRKELLHRAKEFFKNELLFSHFTGGLKRAANLDKYKVNPFLFKYLANFLNGNDDARSIAEALIYPRILGSSITTTFGMQIQKHISKMFDGIAGSTTSGIDIEFIDAIDGRKKYCQLKSGPSTINASDVETIIGHFDKVKGLARTNNVPLAFTDLVVGVIYGEPKQLSSHYKKLNKQFPVYIGKEFWHRLSGKADFYGDLIDAIGEIAIDVDASKQLQEAIDKLEVQIKTKYSM